MGNANCFKNVFRKVERTKLDFAKNLSAINELKGVDSLYHDSSIQFSVFEQKREKCEQCEEQSFIQLDIIAETISSIKKPL